MNPRYAWLERHAALAAALLTLVSGIATMTPDLVGVFFDDAVYLLVAKAMAAGDGLVYPQLPGTPAAIHYPPLFPIVLSVVWRVFPEFPANVIWFKLVNPLLLSGAAAGAVVVAQRLFGVRPLLALFVVLAATVSVPVHVLTTVVLSEPLFLALLFPALLAAERARGQNSREWVVAWVVAAAALAAALVLTRTIGGVVVIATMLVFAHERRWRTLGVYVAAVATLLLPWQLFVWKHAPGFVPELRGSYGPYLEWLVDGYRDGGWPLLRAVASKNIGDVVYSVGPMVSPLLRGPLRQVLTALALAFLAWGAVVALARPAARVAALALGGYLVLVAVWPYQVERFVWGVWPLILLVAYYGARDLHFRVASVPHRGSAIVVVLAILLVAGHTVYNVRGFTRGWASSASRGMAARLLPIVQYVSGDPRLHGKVISTEASPLVALYTGETVVPVEILLVRDHVRDKTLAERAEIIGAIDRRFRPDAYVLMTRGPYLPALLEASFDPGRRFFEISPQGLPVRAFRIPD